MRDKFALGDRLHEALERVGVSQDRVSRWLGRPCGCAERQAKLNQLGFWVRAVMGGKVSPDTLSATLSVIVGVEEPNT